MTDDGMMFLGLALVASTALTAIAVAYWRRQRILEFALRQREQTLLRLTERFGTAEEFIQFAGSREAEALFATTSSPAALARRLLAMVGVAIVLLALAAGFWVTSLGVPADADINFVREADFARWWAVLCAAMGTGLIAASTVCAWLGRRWNVLGS